MFLTLICYIEWVIIAYAKWACSFQLYHGENKLHDDVRFVLDQHAELDIYGVNSLKQVRGYMCRSTRKGYADAEPTSLCYYSLLLLT